MKHPFSTTMNTKFLELTQDLMFIMSFDGDFLYINPAGEMLLGDAEQKKVSKNVLEIFPVDIEDIQEEADADFTDDQTHRTFKNQCSCKDNSIRDIEWKVVLMPKEKTIYGIGRDITYQRLAEERVIESEATVRNKLKAINESDGDMDLLELSDIIDTEVLQVLMEDFYQLTGMLGAVLDVSGKVLVAVGWQDICTKFHRCHPDTLKNCLESDTILTKGVPEGTFKSYRCKNQMWDIVTPIMVDGKHVGNVFMGQYMLHDEEPDIELYRKQARKYGFDEEKYIAALNKVPRFTKETINSGMRFYSKLAGIISEMSFSAIQQTRILALQKSAEEELVQYQLNLEKLVEARTAELTQKNKELNEFNSLFVGREFRIKELKDQLKDLKEHIAKLENRSL